MIAQPTPSMSMTSTLLDLPNELLYNISSYLPTDALLNVARTCRDLNTICLDYYLKGWGIDPTSSHVTLRFFVSYGSGKCAKSGISEGDDEEWEVDEYQDLNLLSALHIAYRMHHIDSLSCYIERSYASLVPKKLAWIFDRLSDLADRLDHIGQVQLHVSGTDYYPTWHRSYVERGHVTGEVSEAKEWATGFGRLLSNLTRKSRTIELIHGNMPFHRHQLVGSQPTTLTESVKRLWKRFVAESSSRPSTPFHLQGPGWKFRWVDEWGRDFTEEDRYAITSPVYENLKVESLSLTGAILLLPPCIDWFSTFLQYSTLTSLSLSSMNLTAEFWNAIILKLSPTLTHLQHLKIQDCYRLGFPLLKKLLNELGGTLRTLEIGSRTDSPYASSDSRSQALTAPILPHLTHLSAGAWWSLYLLGYQWDESYSNLTPPQLDGIVGNQWYLPSLKSLTILHDCQPPCSLNPISAITTLHAYLHPRRPVFQQLGFRSFRYRSGTLGFRCRSIPQFSETFHQEFDALSLGMLDMAQLDYDTLPRLLEDEELVVEWLRTLTSLKILEIRKLSYDDKAMRPKPRNFEARRVRLVRMLKDALRTVYPGHVVELIVDGSSV